MKKLIYLLTTVFFSLTIFLSACSNVANTASSTDEGTSASANNKGNDSGSASKGSTVSSKAFATSDLQGTWNYHGITSGDSPAWLGWFYGQGDFDSSGVLTYTSYLNSSGNTSLSSAGTYSLSSDGIITHSTNSTLHGAMNTGKDLIVRTLTWGGTELESNKLTKLTIFTKSSGTYSTADLQGTWNIHCVASGDSPQWLAWCHGEANIDASGNLTWSSYTDSSGGSTAPATTFSITSGGILTATSDWSNFHGAMNQGKDLIVATLGDSSQYDGYTLVVFQKADEITFTTSDLEGTWNFHIIATGDSPQWTGWAYGQLTFDSSGNYTGTLYDSDGGSNSLNPGTMTISSTGVITEGESPNHSVMSAGKDLIVGTMEMWNQTEVASYALIVAQKADTGVIIAATD